MTTVDFLNGEDRGSAQLMTVAFQFPLLSALASCQAAYVASDNISAAFEGEPEEPGEGE
jgi:hypothetical protein